MAKKLISKVDSIHDLFVRAKIDTQYRKLAITAAENLGGGENLTLDMAIRWLRTNADETSEKGVVKEINACRDLI